MDQSEAPQAFSQEFDSDAPQNGVVVEQRQAPKTVDVVRTERTVIQRPISSYATPDLMSRINNRPAYSRDTNKVDSDRDYLDDLMNKPESGDWCLVIRRFQPSRRADGTSIKCGKLTRSDGQVCSYQIQPYESLMAEIEAAWGGGSYSLAVCDSAGRLIGTEKRTIGIQIQTTNCPPKNEEYETIEIAASKILPVINSESEDIKRDRQLIKEDEEREKLEKRRLDIENRRQKSEISQLRAQKEIADMKRDLMNPIRAEDNSEVRALTAKIEEDRRRHEEMVKRSEEEKRRFEETRKEDIARHEKMIERMEADRKEERRRLEDELKEERRRQEALAAEVRNLATAPKDGGMIEKLLLAWMARPEKVDNTLPMMMEMSKSNATVLSAALTKQPTDNHMPMFEMMAKITQKDNSSQMAMMNSLMQAVVGKKNNELTPDIIFKIQEMGEKRAEKWMEIMGGTRGPEPVDQDSGYDPALGFLGNAGKTLFGGLKSMMEMATQNPAILEVISRIIGKRNPTEIELYHAAQRMEQAQMGNNIPPALPYQPMDQMRAPLPPPPLPPPHPPVMANPRPVQAAPQAELASEIESEASGLPSNGDPEPEPELTPEQMAERNIRDNVMDTIQIVIREIKENKPERAWVKHATDTWNRTFVQALISEPIENKRMQLLASKCDMEVWKELAGLLHANNNEYVRFVMDFRKFIDMNNKPIEPAPVPQPVQLVAPETAEVQAAIA